MALYKSVMCFHGGLEMLFQNTEGSTIGYKSIDGVIYPKKKDYEYYRELVMRISEWQSGAMEYVKLNELNSSNLVKLATKLIDFGKNPPLWGINIFQNFFLDDEQSQQYVSNDLFYKYSIRKLKHSLGSSVWKTGFMKSLFRIPAPYFIIYKVMKK